jgi:hypothetical protein
VLLVVDGQYGSGGGGMERRDLFRICQTPPIGDAEKNRRPRRSSFIVSIRQVVAT